MVSASRFAVRALVPLTLSLAILLGSSRGAADPLSGVAPVFTPDFSQGPVVFDFEDGLQGWSTSGSAERVQTQRLGGHWAISGDGEADPATEIWQWVDLSEVGVISFDQLLDEGTGAHGASLRFFAGFQLLPAIIIRLELPVELPDPIGNPSLRTVDVSQQRQRAPISISWAAGDPDPPALSGLVDNVTFHPLPEPSPAWLVGAGLAVALIRRRPGPSIYSVLSSSGGIHGIRARIRLSESAGRRP